MGQIKTHKKKSSTEIKKKLSLHHRINLDKLSEKYDNFNFQVGDFNKILSNYSIPSFEEENDVSEIIQTLKSKSQKRRLTNPKKKDKETENKPKTTIDNDVLSNFFNSKSTEIKLKESNPNPNLDINFNIDDNFNFNEPRIEAKTHKKVKFNEENQKNQLPYPKKTLDNLIERVSRFPNQNNTHLNSNSSFNSSSNNLNKNQNTHQIVKPIPRIVYNPDPRVPLSSMINYNTQLEAKENQQIQQQKEKLLNLNEIKKDSKKIIKINNKYFNLKDDDLDEESNTNNSNQQNTNSLNNNLEDEPRKKAIVKPTPIIKPKAKTKEEIYQENLANQIELVELKMKEFEDYSEYLPNNHPTLIQLKIDIINEKRKLKELLPEAKEPKKNKELKENSFSTEMNLDIEPNQQQLNNFNSNFNFNSKEPRKLEKEKEKLNTSFGNNLIFKYDPKIVEKEFQQKYMNSHNTLNKTEKSKRFNKFNKNITQLKQQNQLNQSNQSNLITEQPKKLFNNFPLSRKPFNQNQNLNQNPSNLPRNHIQNVKPKVNEYKTVYCVSDDEDFPVPEKKVMVKEINNTTCEIPIIIESNKQHSTTFNKKPLIIDNNNNNNNNNNSKSILLDESIQQQQVIQQKPVIQQPIIKERKNKTLINPNKFKNKSRKNNEETNNNYYNEDKEICPNKWNSLNYNDENDIITHIKPVKLTQKKVKDFLVSEKITNENKNIPTDLMNFLYSSITENSYQVKFVDVLN